MPNQYWKLPDFPRVEEPKFPIQKIELCRLRFP